MNVLLINPPFILSGDSPYSKTGAVLPPLGLLYIAGYLRSGLPEINVEVLDSPAEGLGLEGFGKRLMDYQPDIAGISIYTTTFSAALETAKKIKEIFPACIVVAGGAHASILPEECLASPDIDIAVLGEGEATFKALVECIKAGSELGNISNILYKKGGRILHTQRDSRMLDLDSLPLPARDLVDMRVHRPAYGTFRRLPATNMITSRGCPFSCSFCSKSIFGSRHRTLSALKVFDEINMLIKEYGIKEVIFSDDVFTCDQQRVEMLCDLLIEKKVDVTWSCSTRVNLVEPALLNKMKRSGCVAIGYGIEAGDPDILKKVDKGFSLDKARETVKWTQDAGIETRAFYILGFPGETRASLQKTFEVALELNTDFVIFNMAIPLPGTSLYEEAKSESLLLYDGLELYKRTDGAHPLIKLKDVSEEELTRFYRDAYRRYYLRVRYIRQQLANIRSLDDIKRYIGGFLSFVNWSRQ